MNPRLFAVLTGIILAATSACGEEPQPTPVQSEPSPRSTPIQPVAAEPNLKVAFIGDSGNGQGNKAVLYLIKAEGADVVVHLGDFDYELDADSWFDTIDSALGSDFPFFAAVGNHDVESWSEGCGDPDGCYAELLKERMSRMDLLLDDPDLNDEMYSVEYRGLKLVFTGQADSNARDCPDDSAGYACFIRHELTDDPHIWRICGWHENQSAMQVGKQSNTLGWAVYENCRIGGAIIATAHMHGYQRTKTLLSMRHPLTDPVAHPIVDGVPENPDALRVGPGFSFAFVSGLGGKSTQPQTRCLPATYPYGCNHEWATIYTEIQTEGEAVAGALFIEFNIGGNPYEARGYFKTTKGEVIDTFEITASPPAGTAGPQNP